MLLQIAMIAVQALGSCRISMPVVDQMKLVKTAYACGRAKEMERQMRRLGMEAKANEVRAVAHDMCEPVEEMLRILP